MFAPLTLAAGSTIKELLAAGKYDFVDPAISDEHFPKRRDATDTDSVSAQLLHLPSGISSEAAVNQIRKQGFRPATIEELLLFGAAYPHEQCIHPIVALGTIAEVHGSRYVPHLLSGDGGRYVGLRWWGDEWYGRYRFLGVRESSSRG